MPTIPNNPGADASLEKEIRELARKLEEKKKELAEKPEGPPPEKEVLREVLQRHIEEEKQAQPGGEGFTSPPSSAPLHAVQPTAEEAKKKETREEQIRQLVEIALTKGIKNAVAIARRMTPYLLDELHDHLVDDYYDKLISLRKIKKI